MRMEEMHQRGEHYRLVQQAKARNERESAQSVARRVSLFRSFYRRALSLLQPRAATGVAYGAPVQGVSGTAESRPEKQLLGRHRIAAQLGSELEDYMPGIAASARVDEDLSIASATQ